MSHPHGCIITAPHRCGNLWLVDFCVSWTCYDIIWIIKVVVVDVVDVIIIISSNLFVVVLRDTVDVIIFTSPAGAVAKYCNEHVCVCVCVCQLAYLLNYKLNLYQMFYACCLWPWLNPLPTGWCNPKGNGQFWGFASPLTMHRMGHTAVSVLLWSTDLA